MWERLKKYGYQFTLSMLSAGASLILGLLSLGGMYAIWPAVIPAIISFILSVAYEGEIYTQNLERAFDKLFANDYFKEQLSREFLKEICLNINSKDLGSFLIFKHYTDALKSHDEVKKKAFKAKFHAIITATEPPKDPIDRALYAFLNKKGKHGEPSYHENYLKRLKRRRQYLFGIQVFSFLSAVFMGFGTTYLLVEAFTIIPILAAIPFAIWPLIIVPMSAVAGIAYGLLTYNAITNLMANDTINAWYKKLSDRIKNDPWNIKHIAMAITAALLFSMAVVLTVCTAGTWWTVVQETRPLFKWMTKIPAFVMGVVNPLITGFSALVFNFENTSETLAMIDNGVELPSFTDAIKKAAAYLWAKENVLQWLNPFRIVLVCAVLPLRYVLFAGHLVSIGVTADRIPGLSAYFSAFLGSVSEGFEDVHYFFPHSHATDLNALLETDLGESQGHEHKQDLPSWLIDKLALPIYMLTAAWDSLFSVFNHPKNRITPKDAWIKQRQPFDVADNQCEHHCTDGHHHGHSHDHHAHEASASTPSHLRPHQHQRLTPEPAIESPLYQEPQSPVHSAHLGG